MTNLKWEPEYCQDKCAIAIVKADSTTVGSLQFCSTYLAVSCNKGTVIVTGTRVNRDAVYGLEVPLFIICIGQDAQRLEEMPQFKERSLLPESASMSVSAGII